MTYDNNILQLVKSSVLSTEPTASSFLYGSYARGDQKTGSYIDVLKIPRQICFTWGFLIPYRWPIMFLTST